MFIVSIFYYYVNWRESLAIVPPIVLTLYDTHVVTAVMSAVRTQLIEIPPNW